jgi:hypothetical protein
MALREIRFANGHTNANETGPLTLGMHMITGFIYHFTNILFTDYDKKKLSLFLTN